MKKYLIISVFAAIALVGCSKATPDTPAPDDDFQQEINFTSAFYSGQTKAGEIDFTGDNFKVRAYFTGEKNWANAALATDAAVYMNDILIAKSGSDWKAADPAKKYYWPKAGMLSFMGYTGWTANASWSTTQASILSFAETIAENADPMVSDLSLDMSINQNTRTAPVVPILFHHAAAKVAFLGQASSETGDGTGLSYTVKIDNVTIFQMNTSGTYTVDGSAAKIAGTWSNIGTLANNEYFKGTSTLGTTAAPLENTKAKAISVLPQSVTSLYAKVTYTVEVYNADTNTLMASQQYKEIPVCLAAGDIKAWEQNKIYTYTITISPVDGEISFSPKEVDWIPGGTGSIDI